MARKLIRRFLDLYYMAKGKLIALFMTMMMALATAPAGSARQEAPPQQEDLRKQIGTIIVTPGAGPNLALADFVAAAFVADRATRGVLAAVLRLRGLDALGQPRPTRADFRDLVRHVLADSRLDDPAAGLRVFLVLLDPRATVSPHMRHQGAEAVTVADGLVQVVLASRRPVLRATEALLVERGPIEAFRNLGEAPATLFWILRDP